MEIAQATGLPEWTIRNAIKRGQLPSVRIGRRILVPVQAFEDWIASQAAASVAGAA